MFSRDFCEGAHSTVVLFLFVFQGLFCCVIAEFAPNVTDMSHPDYVTHDAAGFFSTVPCSVVLKSNASTVSPLCILRGSISTVLRKALFS